MSNVTHVFDLTPETLGALCAAHGLPHYAPSQILDWVYTRGVTDPSRMTNLQRADRKLIAREVMFLRSGIRAHEVATDGTQKLLLDWVGVRDGADEGRLPVRDNAANRATECVMIPTARRRTACVSSQAGCPVGCAFCASGIGGLKGNLTRGQIVEQVFRLNHLPGVGRITNVVFMGMGEPLANYAAVTGAVQTINAPWAFGVSARRITISTVGLPAAIRKLVTFEIPVTLALSLHAPDDDLRRELIPWSRYTSIAELLDACDEYFRKTGREITLEYILLRDVNDRPAQARELAKVAQRLRSNVNLIRYNEVRGLPFARPRKDDVRRFQSILRRSGVNVHIRASRGRDIAAACGQLRLEDRRESVT